MKETVVVGIGVVAIILIIMLVLKVCSNFRNTVYKLFIKAEKIAQSGQKMDYVVDNIYSYLPAVVKVFVNENALRWLLQKMFNTVKDFLNDGKINGNGE